MELFGITIPLWAIFIGIIIVMFIAWKLIKFAIKLLIIVVVFFIILIGLDFLGVFETIQQIISITLL